VLEGGDILIREEGRQRLAAIGRKDASEGIEFVLAVKAGITRAIGTRRAHVEAPLGRRCTAGRTH
jgi:hypothetical protein